MDIKYYDILWTNMMQPFWARSRSQPIAVWHANDPGPGSNQWKNSNFDSVYYCLVVYLPLWKMMEFVSWDHEIPYIYIYGKIKFMFQPTNQIKFFNLFQFLSSGKLPLTFIPLLEILLGINPTQRFARGRTFFRAPALERCLHDVFDRRGD